MIYLASPYTALTRVEMEIRFIRICEAIGYFTKLGMTVYSPIAHYHPVANLYTLPTDFKFWQQHNRHMIALAEELWVLALPDWELSVGVAAELDYAAEINKPLKAVSAYDYQRRPWADFIESLP